MDNFTPAKFPRVPDPIRVAQVRTNMYIRIGYHGDQDFAAWEEEMEDGC